MILPLRAFTKEEIKKVLSAGKRNFGFWSFVKSKGLTNKKALKGILGMMRFGNHTSPILLEALGDILSWGQTHRHALKNASLLASRAYLNAAKNSSNPQVKAAYQQFAKSALSAHRIKLKTLKQRFEKESRIAKKWYSTLEKNEAAWIKQGNPEVSFSKHYKEEPRISLFFSLVHISAPSPEVTIGLILLFLLALPVCILAIYLWRGRNKVKIKTF